MTDTTTDQAPDAGNPSGSSDAATGETGSAPAAAPAKKAAARKRAPRKKAAATAPVTEQPGTEQPGRLAEPAPSEADDAPPAKAARKRSTRAKATKKAAEQVSEQAAENATEQAVPAAETPTAGFGLLFQAPDPSVAPAPRRRRRAEAPAGPPAAHEEPSVPSLPSPDEAQPAGEETPAPDDTSEGEGTGRKRRRRGGRGRRGKADGEQQSDAQPEQPSEAAASDAEASASEATDDVESDEEEASSSRRRRRRRRRAGADDASDDQGEAGAKSRQPRKADDEVASVRGSTRLEAKKQRRREGRDAGRRKPIITESEFLARRESVERTMIVREREGRTQIAVLEDGVLVEHYVANETNASMIGNVYLGRVQNVLPSMEAAFIDIGKGRNAVLYAGEVNWDAAGLEGQPRRIEAALKSGDQVLVQVTKDPLGHKGARLTSQVSLPGRYVVYVPNGSMTGISRKLPDTERARLKKILKDVVPEQAGVIVRTAAEGASEVELQRDVERLTAQWAAIEKKSTSSSGGSAPKLLHGEPDLTVRVIRDVFNEDFASLVVSGSGAWDVVQPYVASVAPDLADRASRWTSQEDVFAAHRVDEQLAKAMDRKVWLPSGGSLVIDRTEAMTVVDVNTGKFTGAGGNLEETVTRNNLEAAEEIVRQLRLRDIGGIIVVDFIDMVLESNRDLVLRRLVECLGRDRTKHQVAEVTSLGLVQMTRKRVGQGLLEVFSEPCEHCNGRGIVISAEPVQSKGGGGNGAGKADAKGETNGSGGRSRGGRARGRSADAVEAPTPPTPPAPPRQPIPADFVASLAHHHEHAEHDHEVAPSADAEIAADDVQPVSGESSVSGQSFVGEESSVGEESAVAEQAAVAAQQPAGKSAVEVEVEVKPARRGRRRASAPAGPPSASS